jgi:hypothetical protein
VWLNNALIQIFLVFQYEVSANLTHAKMEDLVTMWELGMSARVLLVLKEVRVKVREYVAILLR